MDVVVFLLVGGCVLFLLAMRRALHGEEPSAGLLGALIGGGEMRDDATRLLANLAEATDRIRQGRGMIGKLVYDDELGEKLERVFTQVSGAIEDVREAAPVGTFIQVLASPF